MSLTELMDDRDRLKDENEMLKKAADKIGMWLSAALDDPKVCKKMKDDIRDWMDATTPTLKGETDGKV